ncbi:hypothetical protein EVAR_63891_1 [Eumeta japonica]|uniref:Uncharacterized protein n=1 Tax=Eumeta variegata TaxID=151549 RepID=A0A4C1ZPP0_EUMVA|nr:hypothetical protein EVAR_63891_1 [Eumeta japonica]
MPINLYSSGLELPGQLVDGSLERESGISGGENRIGQSGGRERWFAGFLNKKPIKLISGCGADERGCSAGRKRPPIILRIGGAEPRKPVRENSAERVPKVHVWGYLLNKQGGGKNKQPLYGAKGELEAFKNISKDLKEREKARKAAELEAAEKRLHKINQINLDRFMEIEDKVEKLLAEVFSTKEILRGIDVPEKLEEIRRVDSSEIGTASGKLR